jgi:diaminopimelate decarboxylase
MVKKAPLVDSAAPTWEQLEAIAQRFGPSFFLAKVARFEANCRRFWSAFRAIYPRTRLAYSYKANYLPAFILRADELGAYSEVVSRFEFDLAQELGIPGERIIYNGPIKRPHDLRWALRAGALVNADSIHEIWQMVRVSDALDAPAAVGVRCQVQAPSIDSRFGIDVRTPAAADALRAIDEAPRLRLAGLHFHYSGDRSAEHYRQRVRAMIDVHREVLGERPLDFIDMGGGFAGAMAPELAAQLSSSPASFEAYAEAVAGEMRAAYGEAGPALILEPGMALVADTMSFATRVEVVKRARRPVAVVDGSRLNVQASWNMFRQSLNLPMQVLAAPGGERREHRRWDVVGHTCVERDVLHEGYEGLLGIGDFVLFDNVGAYTNVLNAPFIRGTPPIVSLSAEGAVKLLRPASTARDLVRSYACPEDAG